MGTGAALMRRDGGVEGLILEKVNGLPLDKRCVPANEQHEVPLAVDVGSGCANDEVSCEQAVEG